MSNNERICRCGCGQIINLKEDNYTVIKKMKRNAYYYGNHYVNKITRIFNKQSRFMGIDFSSKEGQEDIQNLIDKDKNIQVINNNK